MPFLSMRGFPAMALCALCLSFPFAAKADGSAGSGEVPLSAGSETFNTLNASGESGALPNGWYLTEIGTNITANGQYKADNGGTNTGDTYSYGTGSSNERALGTVQSGTNVPTIGAKLHNNTGAAIADLAVSYTGEQWRLGTSGRVDRLDFQFSTNATSLTTGTWTDVNALDFTAPTTTGSAGALDGNASANRTVISATITGVNLANNATLWVRWSDFNASSADDGLAIDDVQFGSPVDNPPALVSSIPQDGDEDFPSNASLVLGFSEAVAMSGTWFTLVCDTSGSITPANSTITGGPLLFFITPNAELALHESCTLTLAETAIVDLTGNPLAPTAPIHFLVGEPLQNPPPQLLSISPQDGTPNFPATGNLHLVFSEAVEFTNEAQAFTLACSSTQGITLIVNELSTTTFSLTPSQVLTAGETCTFTIHHEFVVDLMGTAMEQDEVVGFTVATPLPASEYWQFVNLSSPSQLRCTLHETIKGHDNQGYGWVGLEMADEDPVNPGKILDVYRNCSYAKPDSRVGNPGAATQCGNVTVRYNREHVWPNSLGFANNNLLAYADHHMLHLSDEGHNAHRGNSPYAYCRMADGCTEDVTVANHGAGGGSGVYPGNSNWYNANSYEVWHKVRGNMARAVFYMAIRYEGIAAEDAHDGNTPDLELTDNRSLIAQTANTAAKAYMGLRSVLLEWHAQDEVDARELDRNEIVFGLQGNRNPFIEHPEWATTNLFDSAWPATCVLNQEPPVAVLDSYATAVNSALAVIASEGVLANDTDTEGAPLYAELAQTAGHGTVALAANGGFTYTPATDFCGLDTFTYRASDGVRVSQQAVTASIHVGVNCEGEPTDPEIFADGFEQ